MTFKIGEVEFRSGISTDIQSSNVGCKKRKKNNFNSSKYLPPWTNSDAKMHYSDASPASAPAI
jgi:hypothetical protein